MLDLPRQSFDARRVTQAAANSLSLASFDSNRYSVPAKHAHLPITVIASVEEVRLVDGELAHCQASALVEARAGLVQSGALPNAAGAEARRL